LRVTTLDSLLILLSLGLFAIIPLAFGARSQPHVQQLVSTSLHLLVFSSRLASISGKVHAVWTPHVLFLAKASSHFFHEFLRDDVHVQAFILFLFTISI